MTTYELHHLEVRPAPARQSQSAFIADLQDGGVAELKAAGAEPLGLFTAQLGWAAHELAVLVRWPAGSVGQGDLSGLEAVDRLQRSRLTPALRAGASDALWPGGIYVLRWFWVQAPSEAEFIELSGEAWPDFEGRFDAKVFGLLRAAPSETDTQRGYVRLLLITRYGDHGEWERSRDPSTTAMQIFARRQQLTLWTQAASTLLTEL